MPVKLSSSGGGSVTLDTPSTASNYTVTLPAANTTLADTSSTQTLTNKTLTAAGSNTVEATSGPTSTQLAGQRNKIINGAMMIDQRNAGASVTPSGVDNYTLDRWLLQISQASKLSVQQNASSASPPSGFTNYLGVTTVAGYSITASDYFNLQQRIEGFNLADLGWGTASASSVTLSFQVRSSLTGTFGGAIRNGNNTRSYPFTYSISSANTWTYVAVTIPGDTSGTWLTTNGIGANISWSLGIGSTFNGPSGAWASANYASATGATSVVGTNGATFYITGVQLEKGATATPFENRLYGTELALCQRYYYGGPSFNAYGLAGYADITNICGFGVPLPVPMRAQPSVTNGADTSGIAANGSLYNTTAASAVINNNWWNGPSMVVYVTTNAQITKWTTAWGRIIGFQASAEL